MGSIVGKITILRSDEDKLSNLPPDVLELILLGLPLKEAAKMSVLSRHWRYKWTLLPTLNLDVDFYSSVFGETVFGRVTTDTDDTDKVSRLVNVILLRHDGPIHKFYLDIPSWFPHIDISHWVQFVSRKSIKEFTLSQELNFEETDVPKMNLVPTTMFSSHGFNCLTHLAFHNLLLHCLPLTFGGFPCLTSLVFQMQCRSEGEADKFEALVSKCPLLETLYLELDEPSSTLVIRAPELKSLILKGLFYEISLGNPKILEVLSYECQRFSQSDQFVEFFTYSPYLVDLTLADQFWTKHGWLSEVGHFEKLQLPCEIRPLKSLKLVGVSFDSRGVVSFILFLLRMSPNLQTLEIGGWNMDQASMDDVILGKDRPCLSRLESVKLSCWTYLSRMAILITKLILFSCPALKEITFEAYIPSEEETETLFQEFSECNRASPNVHITVKSNPSLV